MNKNLLPIAILIAGVLIAGTAIYINKTNTEIINNENTSELLSPQEAGEKVIDFVNNNILQGKSTASLVETLEENGLYKVKFTIENQEIETYVTRNGKLFFPEGIDLSEVQEPAVEESQTIGNFSVSNDEVCQENGKPVVYFFGSESCPYCQWEHPIIEKVAERFKENISFHNNMDAQDDMDVFSKYSTGGIPTLVLGCKYYRVGSGGGSEEEEAKNLTALICNLTGNQTADVCGEVQDLINQINE